MKKTIIILIIIIILAVTLIGGFLIKPSASSVETCKSLQNSSLTHIDNCYKNCCEKPYFLKNKCKRFCYLIN
ncbi:hypothetical protein J4218_02415 [Candidatus Pacearchaeota archaeon]|nr:hypothetical protein [Candidatus Pacearchaeota archaeon]